ncbi:MAG: hypothetical protein MUF18_20160 [Fimbriiglobus sp.]|jgi:hypothetical protein|nr:hypothetical protein [Fimbriiglobus sp.]
MTPTPARPNEPSGELEKPAWWEFVVWWVIESWFDLLLILVVSPMCGLVAWWLWGRG